MGRGRRGRRRRRGKGLSEGEGIGERMGRGMDVEGVKGRARVRERAGEEGERRRVEEGGRGKRAVQGAWPTHLAAGWMIAVLAPE